MVNPSTKLDQRQVPVVARTVVEPEMSSPECRRRLVIPWHVQSVVLFGRES